MNSKQLKVLSNLFEIPPKNTIKWTDIEKLIPAINGFIKQDNGSRVRIVMDDQSLNVHTPHPQKELKPYQIRAFGIFL